MGTWGTGNFDSDTASDHLNIIAGRLISHITEAMTKPGNLEPDEYDGVAVACNVELLTLFARQRWVGARVPEVATARAWKQTYLGVWDATIDELEPTPAWRTARRKVLVRTFDALVAAAVRAHGPAPSPKRGRKGLRSRRAAG